MDSVFDHLARDADKEYAMEDSFIVRVYQYSAGASKKGFQLSHRTQ